MSFVLTNFYPKPQSLSGELFLDTEAREWIESGTKKVVVGCGSEDELEALYRQAKEAGLTVHMVVDSGFTEFHGKETKTCLAIGPHANEKIDPITGNLKLL